MTDATAPVSEQRALAWAKNVSTKMIRQEFVWILNRCSTRELKEQVLYALVSRAQHEQAREFRLALIAVIKDRTLTYRVGRQKNHESL